MIGGDWIDVGALNVCNDLVGVNVSVGLDWVAPFNTASPTCIALSTLSNPFPNILLKPRLNIPPFLQVRRRRRVLVCVLFNFAGIYILNARKIIVRMGSLIKLAAVVAYPFYEILNEDVLLKAVN
jgi:hypothetical protein